MAIARLFKDKLKQRYQTDEEAEEIANYLLMFLIGLTIMMKSQVERSVAEKATSQALKVLER